MRDLLKTIACIGLMSVLGCQIDDIAIDVVSTGSALEFKLHEKGAQDVLEIVTFLIVDPYSGQCVWELSTFDSSTFDETKEGKSVLKSFDDLPKVSAALLSRVKFGEVPSGFKQLRPREDQAPTLERGKRYEVRALNGAHRGRAEFIY